MTALFERVANAYESLKTGTADVIGDTSPAVPPMTATGGIRKPPAPPPRLSVEDDTFDLDKPISWFSLRDFWTLRESFEGLFASGSPGSGKSSTSGKNIAYAF